MRDWAVTDATVAGNATAGEGIRFAPRDPRAFFLPAGYRQQPAPFSHDALRDDETYWTSERLVMSARYQYHVYAWAASLITHRGLRSVLDVGCGPGVKLASLISPVCNDIEGIDQATGVAAARRAGAPGRYTVVDLETCGMPAWRTFDLIICADVIEHLMDPDPALRLIRRFSHAGTLAVVSTPDRARLHGRECMASTKPDHVREWSAPEFVRLLRSRSMRPVSQRLFPADDAPLSEGRLAEMKWRIRLASRSPHRCHAVLCRPEPAGVESASDDVPGGTHRTHAA